MATQDLRLIANGGTAIEVDSAASSDTTGVFQSAAAATLDLVAVPNNAHYYRYSDSGSASTYSINDRFSYKYNQTFSGGAGQYCDVFVGFSDSIGSFTQQTNSAGAIMEGAATTNVNLISYGRQASVNLAGSAGTALAETTDRYVLTGLYSSLSQYGSIVSQVFTDAAHTTLSSFSKADFTSAPPTYQYLYHSAVYNAGTAYTLTGTIADIELLPRATAGITLSAGTETDPNTKIAPYPDVIVAAGLSIYSVTNGPTYTSHDYGAGFFGDYTVSGVLNVTAFTTGSSGTQAFDILCLTNAAASGEAATVMQGVQIRFGTTASIYDVYIQENVGGTPSVSASLGTSLATNRPYSFVLNRTGSTLTLKVWNDLVLTNWAGTSQVGATLTWTSRATTTYQYLMPVTTYLSGTTNRNSTFTIGGVVANLTTLTATKGAFSWAGKTSPLNAYAVTATIGAFGWAGVPSNLSTMIQATKGAFSWLGKAVNLNTGGQVNTTPGTFGWAGITSPISHSIATSTGTFGWSGKTSILGATITSIRSWEILKWDDATQKKIPVTGLTNVKYMLYDPSTGYIMDFSDYTFKSSASCTTPQGTMTERILLDSGGNNLTPGVYDILLSTTGLSGLYQEYAESYGTNNYLNSNPVRFQDGVEYLGGMTVAENLTLNSIPANVLAAATVTPIASHVKIINNVTLQGAGISGNSMRPV